MPKRRSYNFKTIQGPSSPSNKQITSKTNNDATSSVNERLSELRRLEPKDAAARKRQLAESVNQRSVPPDLRKVLGVPESAPPRPKPNVRMRDRLRTPGPAPPKSWLAGSSSLWNPKNSADKHGRSRPRQLLRFTRLTGLDDDSVDTKPQKLTHLAMKAIAESWGLLDEEDYPALVDIPLQLRLKLLSYIDFYGSTINMTALKALIQGNERIQCLDLAGLVGYNNLTLRKLGKLLEQAGGQLSHDHSTGVADAWDVEEPVETGLQSLTLSNQFSDLTHLCLSHPSPTTSWRDLLSFSKHIPQITHLSLAYWTRPTLTPNLTTTTVSSQHSPDITAGGSHYYSGLDQDMDEPASLIRQLSANLLCLKWLDLEGCEEWFPALGRLAVSSEQSEANEGWSDNSENPQSIFAGNWKNLSYIRCAQGWLPTVDGISGLQERRDATIIDSLVVDGITNYLKQHQDPLSVDQHASPDILDVEKKKARIWLQREYDMTYAFMTILRARREQGLKGIAIDFGWTQRQMHAMSR